AQTPCTATWHSTGLDAESGPASVGTYHNNTNAGAATVDASWAGDGNHTGSLGSGGFTIAKAPLTVSPDPQSRTYGDPVGSYSFGVTGFKNGETALTAGGYVAPSCSSSYTSTSPVSASPLTI